MSSPPPPRAASPPPHDEPESEDDDASSLLCTSEWDLSKVSAMMESASIGLLRGFHETVQLQSSYYMMYPPPQQETNDNGQYLPRSLTTQRSQRTSSRMGSPEAPSLQPVTHRSMSSSRRHSSLLEAPESDGWTALEVTEMVETAGSSAWQRIEQPLVRLPRPVGHVDPTKQPPLEEEAAPPSQLQQSLRQLWSFSKNNNHNQKDKEETTSRTLDATAPVVETLSLSILPLPKPPQPHGATKNNINNNNQMMYHPRSFRPLDLMDVEAGRAVVLLQTTPSACETEEPVVVLSARSSSTHHLLREEEETTGDDNDDDHPLMRTSTTMSRQFLGSTGEVGFLGRLWRTTLKAILCWTMDPVNALRLSRWMQFTLPFLTGYESYICAQLVEALDHYGESRDRSRRRRLHDALTVVFENRNVSRLVIRTIRLRHDFLYHWYTAVSFNRSFDAFARLPVVGFLTGFPATENFPSTRDHALASIFRVVLGQGTWWTRFLTGGRESLVSDNPKAVAQNLTAESNGFELANRNQYGTYFGRIKILAFRQAHRLPVDESLVRSVIAQPISPLTNNGVVHVLRQLAKHWHNMLDQEFGNFAHQRMEQLDPFETLRFHMPEVLLVLSLFRGRNRWDDVVLAPTIQRLQQLRPSNNARPARDLVQYLLTDVADPVCGGVEAIAGPLKHWLQAIDRACVDIEKEAVQVYQHVCSAELGIRLGHDVSQQVSWRVPSDRQLKDSILAFITGEQQHGGADNNMRYERQIRSALLLTTPRDKRTLIELVQQGLTHTRPAQLLLARVKTLLQRELRREYMNDAIRLLSRGEFLSSIDSLVVDDWYLMEGKKIITGVYIYLGAKVDEDQFFFLHVDSGVEVVVSLGKRNVRVRKYVPVAEAIARAQKAFMTIELDHGRKFIYNAFMEFTWLRKPLGRMIVVSQMACDMLDKARMNILFELIRSKKTEVAPADLVPGRTYFKENPETLSYQPFVCPRKYDPSKKDSQELASSRIVTMLPQNVIVVGGGPTGLLATIHCVENCILSGGTMKLFEARDAFDKGGSTYERAQIVRLDARWIATLRYYLGTGFEDVFIPASGETDSQLGNILPTQGFVEITIKDLESMLHVEVSRLWSRGIIQLFTGSKAQYDQATNSLTKYGQYLKVEDMTLRLVDEEGRPNTEYHRWKVVQLLYPEALSINEVKVGDEYGVFVRERQAVESFKLESVDLVSKTYCFRSLNPEIGDIEASEKNLPSIYPAGTQTKAHGTVDRVVLECVKKGPNEECFREELSMSDIGNEKFTLDIGQTHVFEAIGKPYGPSSVHFNVTTNEPYAVCCLQGLKVSLGMHNFGEKRFGSGIVDDIRSVNDQNTRIISDFTKMVRVQPIVEGMLKTISTDKDWQLHFSKIIADSMEGNYDVLDGAILTIQTGCEWLVEKAVEFQRQTLQTRFFETGDNFYLGMEMLREYSRWKNNLAEQLVSPLAGEEEQLEKLRDKLMHGIDRLWYENCLETIRKGDVYNPGARHRVPKLYLIDSLIDRDLSDLLVGDSFRLVDDQREKYEILVKAVSGVLVRTVEGYVSWMPRSTRVYRQGNLTRSPDGNQESPVALAQFNLCHSVNYRSMRLSNVENGYVFAFAGDSQAVPHFMRYSGLTGSAINAHSFNIFLGQAIDGAPFTERFRLFSKETNWSNGEVVQRGTTANYGEDGFLRPGFSYNALAAYLTSKVIECRQSGQPVDNILTRDWKIKIAASLIPRGLEMDKAFAKKVSWNFNLAVFEGTVARAEKDDRLQNLHVGKLLRFRKKQIETRARQAGMETGIDLFWDHIFSDLDASLSERHVFRHEYGQIAKATSTACAQVIDFAEEAYRNNLRISSEGANQPKPVDSIVDDFAVEAQNFANSLTISAAFAAAALAFRLVDQSADDIVSAIFGVLNIVSSFGTMTEVARYKIRNEEARIVVADEKFLDVQKAVFALLDKESRDNYVLDLNPFYRSLEAKVLKFRKIARYYGYKEPTEFDDAYSRLKKEINNVEEIHIFRKFLALKLIAGTYHVNSYVQETLVEVFRVATDMVVQFSHPEGRSSLASYQVKDLFFRLYAFEPKLEKSLQRGPVLWGFVKQRRFAHWDIVVTLRYFYSLLWFPCCSGTSLSPVQNDILGLLRRSKRVSRSCQDNVLRREIRDLATLFWATRESDVSSVLFVVVSLSFAAAVLFTFARIFPFLDALNEFAFYATTISSLGAILAVIHFVRKFRLLAGLLLELHWKAQLVSGDRRQYITQIIVVTTTQLLLTIVRLLAAGAAAVALPYTVAENGFSDSISTDENLPFYIALGAVVTAIAATLFFFLVEYVVRYNLTPELGPFVCQLFRTEIENIYDAVKVPLNGIETKQVQERGNWEYTAREFLHRYRFDTVFAADRFGQILQYIQGGMLQSSKTEIQLGAPQPKRVPVDPSV